MGSAGPGLPRLIVSVCPASLQGQQAQWPPHGEGSAAARPPVDNTGKALPRAVGHSVAGCW